MLPPFQFLFEARQPSCVRVLLRRDAQNSLEGARELRSGGANARPRLDGAARRAHQGDRGIRTRGIGGAATQTRAVPLAFGGLRNGEERDQRASRPAAGAGGTAIDTGRAHGVHELAVATPVARNYRVPTLIGAGRRSGNDSGIGHALNIATNAWGLYPVFAINVCLGVAPSIPFLVGGGAVDRRHLPTGDAQIDGELAAMMDLIVQEEPQNIEAP